MLAGDGTAVRVVRRLRLPEQASRLSPRPAAVHRRGAGPERACHGEAGNWLGRESRSGAGKMGASPRSRAEPRRGKALGLAAVRKLPGARRGLGLRHICELEESQH